MKSFLTTTLFFFVTFLCYSQDYSFDTINLTLLNYPTRGQMKDVNFVGVYKAKIDSQRYVLFTRDYIIVHYLIDEAYPNYLYRMDAAPSKFADFRIIFDMDGCEGVYKNLYPTSEFQPYQNPKYERSF